LLLDIGVYLEIVIWKLEIPIKNLLFRFFMGCMLPAPFAEFFDFNFSLNFALVFARPVVDALADCALHFDKILLRHVRCRSS